MVGLPVTLESLNRELGTVCQQLDANFAQIEKLKEYSDNTSQEVIEGLGATADDAFLIKLIIQEMDQLRTIYKGQATLAVAKDFTEQARKAWGL
jgi:hypothetical protein